MSYPQGNLLDRPGSRQRKRRPISIIYAVIKAELTLYTTEYTTDIVDRLQA